MTLCQITTADEFVKESNDFIYQYHLGHSQLPKNSLLLRHCHPGGLVPPPGYICTMQGFLVNQVNTLHRAPELINAYKAGGEGGGALKVN